MEQINVYVNTGLLTLNYYFFKYYHMASATWFQSVILKSDDSDILISANLIDEAWEKSGTVNIFFEEVGKL